MAVRKGTLAQLARTGGETSYSRMLFNQEDRRQRAQQEYADQRYGLSRDNLSLADLMSEASRRQNMSRFESGLGFGRERFDTQMRESEMSPQEYLLSAGIGLAGTALGAYGQHRMRQQNLANMAMAYDRYSNAIAPVQEPIDIDPFAGLTNTPAETMMNPRINTNDPYSGIYDRFGGGI